MVTKLFAWDVAGALLIPAAATGHDGNSADRPLLNRKSAGPAPLPAIPYPETIRWLSVEATGPGQKVDQLRGPSVDQLKFALDMDSTLVTRDSSLRGRAGPAGWPER